MKKLVLVLVFMLSVLSIAAAVVATAKAQATTIDITIYAGEISSSQYGFGNSSTIITSPGPSLTFHSGDIVKVTLQNAGSMPHNWAIVDQKSSSGAVQWSAQVGNPNAPVAPGQSNSVTFTVGNAGTYYYLCQVDGHVALGMWGNVTVESAIPEFPVSLMIVFLAATVTALAAYAGRLNIKRTMKL